MSVFDAIDRRLLTDPTLFRERSDGMTEFYPWGPLGTGYLVSDDQQRRLVTQLRLPILLFVAFFLVHVGYVGTTVALDVSLSSGWTYGFALAGVGIPLFYLFRLRRVTRRLPPVEEAAS